MLEGFSSAPVNLGSADWSVTQELRNPNQITRGFLSLDAEVVESPAGSKIEVGASLPWVRILVLTLEAGLAGAQDFRAL